MNMDHVPHSKHAYLILAHNNPKILEILVGMLDDERNDIYLHVDKKSGLLAEVSLKTERAGLHILEKRLDVRWGDLSLVEVEFLVFEEAHKHGPYAYYHLISGVDLPIKPQDYIHEFFRKNAGCEFIGYSEGEYSDWLLEKRTAHYHFFTEYIKSSWLKRRLHGITTGFLWHVLPKRKWDYPLYRGNNWVSITEKMVTHLLKYKSWVLKAFRHTEAADEIFLQTIAMLDPDVKFYDQYNEFDGAARAIDWDRGNPYVWHMCDKDILKASPSVFARKFDWSVDKDIITWLSKEYGK